MNAPADWRSMSDEQLQAFARGDGTVAVAPTAGVHHAPPTAAAALGDADASADVPALGDQAPSSRVQAIEDGPSEEEAMHHEVALPAPRRQRAGSEALVAKPKPTPSSRTSASVRAKRAAISALSSRIERVAQLVSDAPAALDVSGRVSELTTLLSALQQFETA
jgi:hypothetical protein